MEGLKRYGFEIIYPGWFEALSFALPASSRKEAAEKLAKVLVAAGAEILRQYEILEDDEALEATRV